MGVRLALGAGRGRVARLLLGEQIVAVFIGLLAGGVVAAWTAGALRREVYAIAPTDPIIWAATALTIVATASLGTILPALRASRIDPVSALRVE
jgi:ABC-type antimicrobial peptide transport system permease subunit